MPRTTRQNEERVNLPRNSEVDAYLFIRDNLKTLGWDVRNPDRSSTGQVYTQNECLSHLEIQKYLGQEKPENVIKISESAFWVIEAKRDHRQLGQALEEAEYYAKKINKSSNIQIKIISGVAGNNNDGYFVKSRFFDDNRFLPIVINNKEISSLVSPEIARTLVETNNAEIADIPINENLFLAKAEKINEILHLGAINKNYRARVMAALLLALIDETPPNVDAAPSVLIRDINSRADAVLRQQGKPEFYEYIKISLPPTEDNHIKFKKAIVQTIQELNNLNIRSAMNSGADVLGKFYEVFLKYGNGAKEIGIVLTPRHVTKFAADVLNISLNDLVFDPTCGTGGFLVAAFDYIKKGATQKQIERFKQNNLFGVEQETEVVALAIVNMIFRGDGKNNIIDGNCFQKHLSATTRNSIATAKYITHPAVEGSEAITKVIMNPPFALKSSDDKEHRFIDHALMQMVDGGVLFSVLPYSSMVKGAGYFDWRKNLLENNTLLSVITFPNDLFYPVGINTIGVFIKKGIPHPNHQKVLWLRATNDGFAKKKGKRLPSERIPNDLEKIKDTLKSFLINPSLRVDNIPAFHKTAEIDFTNEDLELIAEAYLDEKPISTTELNKEIENLMRGNIAFQIKFEDKISDIPEKHDDN